MTLTIEEAIERVPFLAKAKEVKKTVLGGGITNQNFKVDYDGNACVIRITGANTELLGIRREVEYTANKAAGELGIAPEVLFFIEPEGYLVTRFVKGKHIPPETISHPDFLLRVARKLRLFHTRGPKLDSEFNAFRRVEMLTEVSKSHNSKFPPDFDWIMYKLHQAEEALLKDPYIPTPCHNDLLNLNWMDEDTPGDIGEIRLLDWEYAGMGDIFFDLGNFCHHHRLNDDLIRVLLKEYFGEVTARIFARCKLMSPVSEIHEGMWGTTQTGISTLDEDFQGYADLFLGRARQQMTDFRWDQWLIDVTKK